MRLLRVFFSVFALIACRDSLAIAEASTVPLTPVARSGAYGNYLSSPFDFGTAFSRIDSVKLEFTMTGGYEGTAVSTGNSSYFRYFATVIHDEAAAIDNVWPPDTAKVLTNSSFHISAGIATELTLGNFVQFPSAEPVASDWPDFLLTGHGSIAFIDVFESSFHPLPSGIEVSSSTSWSSPGEILSATLTIEGTPVPEPISIWLIVVLATIMLAYERPINRNSAFRISA